MLFLFGNGILQKNPVPFPLSVVILVNSIKDFYEDWKRKKSDDKENSKNCLIYNFKKQKRCKEKTYKCPSFDTNPCYILENKKVPQIKQCKKYCLQGCILSRCMLSYM